MPTLTVSLPDDLHSIVKGHKEVNWSEVARRALWNEARKLQLLDKLAAQSRLSEKDIEELDHAIKHGLRKHYED